METLTTAGPVDEVCQAIESRLAGNPTALEAAATLRDIMTGAQAAGVAGDRLQIDLSIARGLDYYTGTVLETTLNPLPGIGSVCSGGRYDNLAEVYSKRELPGIGASLGLDRLLAALEELKLIEPAATMAPVFIPFFEADHRDDYLALAYQLRQAGLGVEVYPESKKLGQQLKYAGEKGCRFAVICGGREFESGTCQLKDLIERTSVELEIGQGVEPLVAAIKAVLTGEPSPAG